MTLASTVTWNITWVIAPIEGPADAGHGHVPPDAPPNVQGGPAGKSLVDLLLVDEIDVLVAAFMPTGFLRQTARSCR